MSTFKSKMKHLDPNWADQIWENAKKINGGKGADWLSGLAALAVTGARPVSLERGITFRYIRDDHGNIYIEATVPGAKIIKNPDGTPRRGQELIKMNWQIHPVQELPPRSKELRFINEMLVKNPHDPITISYNADSIATSVRSLSKQIWPRRTRHVSPICYRELFSSNAKAAGVAPAELAMAMGHLSSESQGKYAARPRKAKGEGVKPKKVFSTAAATTKVKTHRSPMARFKAAQSLKTNLKKKAMTPKL